MDDNVVEICVIFKTEKPIESFYNKFSEFQTFNFKRVMKLYYNIKDKILQQCQVKMHVSKVSIQY